MPKKMSLEDYLAYVEKQKQDETAEKQSREERARARLDLDRLRLELQRERLDRLRDKDQAKPRKSPALIISIIAASTVAAVQALAAFILLLKLI